MMTAWWRECANRVRPAARELRSVTEGFSSAFDEWLAKARRAALADAEGDACDASLLDACDAWRRVFASTASLRQMVPPDDGVWRKVANARDAARDFVQLLGSRLVDRLDRHAA